MNVHNELLNWNRHVQQQLHLHNNYHMKYRLIRINVYYFLEVFRQFSILIL